MLWLALFACSSEPVSPGADAAQEAGARENTDLAGLEEALASGALVVDVRYDREWASGHVPGVTHVPLPELSDEHPVFASHPREKPVYFICETGGRSGRAADQMAAAGFHAVNVTPGTSGWRKAGKPLETP